jgi:hypothetical protein
MAGREPGVGAGDFLLVEDPRTGDVVSWPSPGLEEGDAWFPDHRSLQLLFGCVGTWGSDRCYEPPAHRW